MDAEDGNQDFVLQDVEELDDEDGSIAQELQQPKSPTNASMPLAFPIEVSSP